MGPALCLVSAACFGAMPIFGKLAYEAGVTPGTLLLLRFALAAALLAAVLLVVPRLRSAGDRPRTGTATRRAVLTALGLGAIGYATQSTFYFSALTRIEAPLVALVLYTYPAMVTLGAAALGREHLTPRRVGALLVSSFGTLLVLLGAGGVSIDVIGVALAFGGAVTYTVYILVADTAVHRLPPVVLSCLVMTGAAGALLAREAVAGHLAFGFEPEGWLWVSSIAVVSTAVAILAFFAGMQRTGPSTAAILSTFEPVVTTALAAVVLAELLAPVQLAGGALVLAAIPVLQVRRRRAVTSRGRRRRSSKVASDSAPSLDLPR